LAEQEAYQFRDHQALLFGSPHEALKKTRHHVQEFLEHPMLLLGPAAWRDVSGEKLIRHKGILTQE